MSENNNIQAPGLSDQEIEKLFIDYFLPLTVFAWEILNQKEIAEDIVHDLFLKLHENRSSYNASEVTSSYLYRSVYNKCINYLDHRKVRQKHVEKSLKDETISSPDPFSVVHYLEFEEKYLEALESLAPKCKQIFKMSRMEGLGNQEIADKLNLSKRTVDTQISNALKVFRKKLSDYITIILWLLVMHYFF